MYLQSPSGFFHIFLELNKLLAALGSGIATGAFFLSLILIFGQCGQSVTKLRCDLTKKNPVHTYLGLAASYGGWG